MLNLSLNVDDLRRLRIQNHAGIDDGATNSEIDRARQRRVVSARGDIGALILALRRET